MYVSVLKGLPMICSAGDNLPTSRLSKEKGYSHHVLMQQGPTLEQYRLLICASHVS